MTETRLFQAETTIILTPTAGEARNRKPITLKDSSKSHIWNGDSKNIPVRIIHNPGDGSPRSGRTNIVYSADKETILLENSAPIELVEEFDPFIAEKKGLFIKDDAQVTLRLHGLGVYSSVIIERRSHPSFDPRNEPMEVTLRLDRT
jgi:hypothetical protein